MPQHPPAFVHVCVTAPLLLACLQLAGCGTQPVGATAAPETSAAPPMPRGDSAAVTDASKASSADSGKQAPPKPGAKTIALARAGDRPYDKTFDDIRFDIKPGQPFHREMLPEAIESLTGTRIRIRGYILPTAQKRGIRQFVLVRDNQECCFGPGAALYDCILVEMHPGKTAEFSIRPVAVEGTFNIQEIKGPDGTHLAVYHLAGESVR
jgi:hypothetical protein